jgi:hypothetical protein
VPAPSGQPEIITDARQIYLKDFDRNPEQSAIYKEIHFNCNDQTLLGICVTPQCEMGKKRTLFHTFCQLIPFDLFLEHHLKKQGWTAEKLECTTKPTENTLKNFRDLLIKFQDTFIENKAHRYHFLPGFNTIPHSFVDFQAIECIRDNELKSENKIAVLDSPWREQIPTRYSFYQGRIGTAPLSDTLITEIFKSADLPLITKAWAQ